MLTLRSILCAVDFSDQSQHALRWAVALAVRHQSRLTVFTAVDPLLAQAARTRFGLDLPRAEMEPAIRDLMTAVLPAMTPWTPVTSIDVRVGDASDVILETADRERAGLIVMGTHGLGGFRKLLLGSTMERVLGRTHTPLLAVPGVDAPLVILDAAGPRFVMKTILMATDFSEASTNAVQWAADLAERLEVPLVLTHVVTPIVVPARWRSYVEGADEERVAHARVRLEKLSAGVADGVPREVVVSIGRPADSIASLAEERGTGLIVMGLIGDRGARAPRPGSIAYRVLCLAQVPVLVVPPHSSSQGAPPRTSP